jgi:hypothetical protein
MRKHPSYHDTTLPYTEAFIVQHMPGNTYAYFYDMVSLLQLGGGENHVSVLSVWDMTYHMKKAGFTCKGKAIIFASMNTILPTCLGELTRKTVESTLPLPTIPTHGHWTSKGGMMLGCHCDINHRLTNVKGTLETQQGHHLLVTSLMGPWPKSSCHICMLIGPSTR